ncbi:MAG: hypothetical protein UR93_C0007G0009 [Berkelbacteria bacterium GW2011_GWA2_35_9]|uniref:Uncharacterized protein n=1 Tax=Berkelbacteria bacterium GW2011_GWA2_35_9 TaxID=1618333 RepID=A0A0G0GAT4_9BACT|nr:MAG: hypothetical protein UR93_C0007G0009 [Berkelbacteria bacterium GW2011_GWA2_35_9]
MIYNLINLLLVEKVLAFNDFNVFPNRPENVPEKFSESGGVSNAGGNLANIIEFIFNFIIAIAGAIFVLMLLIGGITYLVGSGNEEQTGKGKKMMIDAIIGIFIVLASWAIGTYILNAFGYRS